MGAPINVQMFDMRGIASSGLKPALTIKLYVSSITVAELIEERVQHEINKGEDSLSFIPHPDEVVLNGIRKSPKIGAAIEYAKKSFKAGEYFLFVNDIQVESLDEKIILTEDTTVKFIQLIPLVGG